MSTQTSILSGNIWKISGENWKNEKIWNVLKKIQYFRESGCKPTEIHLYLKSCDMIAVKREVAANCESCAG